MITLQELQERRHRFIHSNEIYHPRGQLDLARLDQLVALAELRDWCAAHIETLASFNGDVDSGGYWEKLTNDLREAIVRARQAQRWVEYRKLCRDDDRAYEEARNLRFAREEALSDAQGRSR